MLQIVKVMTALLISVCYNVYAIDGLIDPKEGLELLRLAVTKQRDSILDFHSLLLIYLERVNKFFLRFFSRSLLVCLTEVTFE